MCDAFERRWEDLPEKPAIINLSGRFALIINGSEYEEMRAPFQVLVIPFRRTGTVPEFAVLKRSDASYWQFVAGGGENDETPAQAATRETEEEIGITGELAPARLFLDRPKELLCRCQFLG